MKNKKLERKLLGISILVMILILSNFRIIPIASADNGNNYDILVITYNYGYEYVFDTHNVENALVEAGYSVDALYNPLPGVITSSISSNDYSQIWLWDITTQLGLTDTDDKTALINWYDSHRGNIIVDARSYGAYYDYIDDKLFIENEANSFSLGEGGLWIGCDHDPSWTKNANALLTSIGYETVTGINYNGVSDGDTTSELLTTPNSITPSILYAFSSVGYAPIGIQYDGVELKSLLWNVDGLVYTSYALSELNQPPNPPSNPSPIDSATNVDFNPTLSVDVSDPDGNPMDVTFYDAVYGSIIGTDYGVPSGGTAKFTWTDLYYENTYFWFAEADDGTESTTSNKWFFTTKPNQQPVVEITSPQESNTVIETVTITGIAEDYESEVTLVEIRTCSNDWEAASGTNSWSYEWDTTNIPIGEQLIEARSFDGELYSTVDSVIVNVPNYFIHITDTHVMKIDSYDWKNMVTFLKSTDAEFVICSGDLVEWGHGSSGKKNYEEFLKPLHPKEDKNSDFYFIDPDNNIPLYCCPGNHDYRIGDDKYWTSLPTSSDDCSLKNYEKMICMDKDRNYMVLEHDGLAIFSLDSGFDAVGDIDVFPPEGSGLDPGLVKVLDKKLDMLDGKRDWKDTSGLFKVIFMHHPYINGYQRTQPEYFDAQNGVFLLNRILFLQICNRYAVEVVLGGHDHEKGEEHGGVWNEDGYPWYEGAGTKFVMTDSVKDNNIYRRIYITDNGLEIGESAKI